MTERQWLQTTDPQALLRFVAGKLSPRRARLLAVACCRAEHGWCRAEAFVSALAAAERLADGGDPADAETAQSAVWAAFDEAINAEDYKSALAMHIADTCVYPFIDPLHIFTHPKPTLLQRLGRVRQLVRDWFLFGRDLSGTRPSPEGWCPLVRDVSGNPFRTAVVDPVWRSDTVLSLARWMYESRDFSAMPILGDALQDAGCDSDDILNHCRHGGVHVRGCWVLDLLLGRE